MSDILSRMLGSILGGSGGGLPGGSRGGVLGGSLGGGSRGGGGLGDLLGGGAPTRAPAPAPAPAPSGGGLFGGLGGIKGIALGALLAYLLSNRGGASGLSSLVNRFRTAGLGNEVDSWISSGSNRPVSPDQLARVLPPEEVDRWSRETGMGRDGLLGMLAGALPGVVDHLSPRGRVPQTDDELPQDEGGLRGLLGGLFGGDSATPDAGRGQAGGLDALYGGQDGGAGGRHPGLGGSFEDSPPRVGPAPRPDDDDGLGGGPAGTPHGRGPLYRT